jgi:MOSC domain-containing protein YiiM
MLDFRVTSWRAEIVHTSVWKDPVQGRLLVRRLNVDGDAQGDLAGHGGEHPSSFGHQTDSYPYWERKLCGKNLTFGQFGETATPNRAGSLGQRKPEATSPVC